MLFTVEVAFCNAYQDTKEKTEDQKHFFHTLWIIYLFTRAIKIYCFTYTVDKIVSFKANLY